MPRYFFHTKDGQFLRDEDGTVLPDIDAARREASTLLGEIIGGGALWNTGHFAICVSDETDLSLFNLEVTYNPSPSISPRA